MRVAICVWPGCEASTSLEVDVPLCDSHAATAYRRISAAIREASVPRLPVNPGAPRRPSRASRNRTMTPGTIYYARFGDQVKIGFTTDLRGRMKALRPDEVLATEPGTMLDERERHHRFGPAWVSGEMFRPTRELMAHVATLRGAP